MEPPDFTNRILDFGRMMDGENRDSKKVPAMKPELAGNDIPFIEAELQRLRRGLAFWEARQTKGG